MNKTFKRVLLLAAVVCMFCALFAVASAETACVHEWEEKGDSLLPGATCTTNGIYKIQCKKCLAVDYIQRPGHKYETSESFIAATCFEPRMKVYKCENYATCGSYILIAKSDKNLALEHKVNGVSQLQTVRMPATCLEPACMLTTCKLGCDYRVVVPLTGDEAVAPLGHLRYTSVPAQMATCIDDGNTAEVKCSRCNEVLVESVVIPANPNAHDLKAQCTIEPDCEKQTNGVGTYVCELCHQTIGSTTVIPWEHDYSVEIDEEPATCSKAGWVKVACSVCEDVKLETVAATGDHVYVLDVIPADCDTPAMQGMFCACGAVNGEMEVVPGSVALGHDEIATVYKTATCFHPSGIVITCARGCGYVANFDYEGIVAKPALEHTPKAVPDKAATCAERGLVGKVVCGNAGCTHVINEGTVIPKDPTTHVWGDSPISTKVAPKCETNEVGYGTYKCKNCTETKDDVIPVEFGHSWKFDGVVQEQTCKDDRIIKKHCEKCGLKDEKYYVPGYEATGEHDYTQRQWKEADCENPRRVYEKCALCGELGELINEYPEQYPAKGHDFENKDCKVTRFDVANCYYPAGVLTECYNGCGETQFKADDPKAEALGHDKYTVPTVLATCKEEGLKDKVVCLRCEKVLDEGKVLPVDENAHVAYLKTELNPDDCITMTPGFGAYHCKNCETFLEYGIFEATHTKPADSEIKIIKKANCEETGLIEYTCTVCKKLISEVVAKDETAHVWKNYSGNGIHNLYWPDCEAGIGYEGNICTVCGEGFETMKKFYGWTNGHIWKSQHLDATCYQVAGYEVKCELCGETEFHPDDDSAVAAHTPEAVKDQPATCVAPGYKDKVVCKVCETVLQITWIDIDVNAHTAEVQYELADRKADCLTQKDGFAKFWCKDCHTHIGYDVTPYEVYGHNKNTVKDVAATCVADGALVVECTKCKLTLVNEVRPATGIHDWKTAEVGKAADCENPARVVIECKNCSAEKDVKYVTGSEATGHDYDGVFYKADCENPARIVYTCANDDTHTYTEVVTGALAEAAWGHKEVSGDVAATCMTKGYTDGRIVCERCETVIVEGTEIPVNPANHVLAETPVSMEAGITCTKAGKATFMCTLCNYMTVADYTKPHVYGDLKVNDDYTYTYQLCVNCEAEKIVEWLIPHCDHEELPVVVENKVEATCTEAGSYDEVIYCLFCKEELSRVEKTIEALGHTEEDVAAVEPTCTETGLTAGTKCSVCGEPVKAQEVVEALGHTEEELAAVEATCTTAGLTAGKKCVVCGVVTVEQKEIAALGHKEEEIPAVAADCTTAGLTAGKKCTVCGEETVKQEVVEALGHTVVVLEGKAATCTEAGLTAGEKCSVCEEILKAQEEIAALGHTVVVTEGTPATCDKPGMTAGKTCSVCGEAIEGAVEIPALGHKYTVTWDFNADFTKKIKISTCDVCGEVVKSEPMDF